AELDASKLHCAGAVGHSQMAGMRLARTPLDEERQPRVGGGFFDAGELPFEHSTIWRCSRSGLDVEMQAPCDVVDGVRTNRPSERTDDPARPTRDPTTEWAGLGAIRIDDCDQLQVHVRDRNDPVGGAPPRMTSPLDRRQA